MLTRPCRRFFIVASIIICVVLVGRHAAARVAGPCVNCHTMHNSQDGGAVFLGGSKVGWDSDNKLSGGSVQAMPESNLLVTGCVGCHSSTTSDTIINVNDSAIPIVFNINGYPDSSLAGGNFYHVALGGAENDVFGHNVLGISGPDNNIAYVPGKGFGGVPKTISDCVGCHVYMPGWPYIFATQRTGNVLLCIDCHYQPRHHADDSAAVVDGNGGWYRFIYGVKGIEDADWEQTLSPTDHNEYQGETEAYGASISDSGCRCHNEFHALTNPDGVGAGSAWLRHPVDVAIPDAGEYADYKTYSPEAPVARPDLASYEEPSDKVTPGTAQVMCLSCHRPHGSDQPDLLRWDYKTMLAHDSDAASGGCFTCHTQKDDP